MTIYFDHNATTPIRPEVFEAMRPFLAPDGTFGNPSSIHAEGRRARAALENARATVAAFLGAADPSEIVFTSSGTEADNMAVIGAAFQHRDKGRLIVTSAVEHHAVLHSCDYLEKEHGFRVAHIPVDDYGRVSPGGFAKVCSDDAILVSVMTANNEVGALQPIEEIGKLCGEKGILFHTDAVQAAGKISIDVKEWPVDMLSISGHKLYAPKGIGALYIRRGVRLHALIHGGVHERNRRAGTENVAGAVGLAAACEAAARERTSEGKRIEGLRDRLEKGLLEGIPGARLNGHPTKRLGNTSHLSFDGVDGESLVMALDQPGFTLHEEGLPPIAASTGAACSAGILEPSHVLAAMGLSKDRVRGGVRFSLGRGNTAADVDAALDIIPRLVARLRDEFR
jgi:cysteine desulfurase